LLNGDISSRVEPRLLVVFEGLLGFHTDAKARAKYSTLMKVHRYQTAIRTFSLNEQLQRVIWDVTYGRFNYAVDVVTFLDARLVGSLQHYLDEEGLPVGQVTYSDKLLLARSLNYRPDVAGVFYPASANPDFSFGSKGYAVDPNNPNLIGGLGLGR
jgi:hypothetical protein